MSIHGLLHGTVHGHPALHRALLALTRRPARFPEPGDDLFLTGFPRSANSFSYHLACAVFPGLRIAGHVHSHGSVALARRLGIPVLMLLRPPADAIASLLHMRMGRAPARALSRHAGRAIGHYVRYHEYAICCAQTPHEGVLEVVTFHDVVSDPATVVRRLQAMNLVGAGDAGANVRLAAFLARERQRNEARRNTPHFGPHLDRPSREAIRETVEAHPLMVPARDAHRRLLAAAGLQGAPHDRARRSRPAGLNRL